MSLPPDYADQDRLQHVHAQDCCIFSCILYCIHQYCVAAALAVPTRVYDLYLRVVLAACVVSRASRVLHAAVVLLTAFDLVLYFVPRLPANTAEVWNFRRFDLPEVSL